MTADKTKRPRTGGEDIDPDRLPTDFTSLETEAYSEKEDPISAPRRDVASPGDLSRLPEIDSLIGHYRLVERIGQGGMAVVYRAHDTHLDRDVAIKFLPPEWATETRRLQRFMREARLLASLNHPNIVVIHEIQEMDPSPFMVMELVQGRPLRAFLPETGLPVRQLLGYAIPIAEAVAAAHTQGITHRDLKPENVIVMPDDRVKVLDFGIAKRAPLPEDQDSSDTAHDSLTGDLLLGTIAYMSPEQLRSESIGPSSDVFSFGTLLYEMAAGRRPFRGKSQIDVAAAILTYDPAPLPTHQPIPDEFRAILAACHAKLVPNRPSTMSPVLERLRVLNQQLERSALEVFATDARRQSRTDISTARSVAVLPFQDLTAERNQEIFCIGLSEEIASELSRVSGLRVTVASRMNRASIDPLEVGRLLGMSAILDGSVRRSSEKFRITARLLSIPGGDQLWSTTFERPILDALEVQEEVAREVANALDFRPPATQRHLGKHSPEAYAAYLRGRFFWSRRYEDGLKQALRCFDEALSLDPTMALAHAGRGDCYVILGHYGFMDPKHAYKSARSSAGKALAIAPDLAEAYATMGWIAAFFDWSRGDAERAFRESLRLDPEYTTAHEWYGIHLLSSGRPAEALSAMKRARELDPLSLMVGSILGWTLFETHNDEEAERVLSSVLEMEPRFGFAHNVLAIVIAARGRDTEAIDRIEQNAMRTNREALTLSFLGYLYGRVGRFDEARKIAEELIEASTSRFVSQLHIALPLLGAGRFDSALDHLEAAVDQKESFFASIHHSRLFAEIRASSRFQALVARLGVEPVDGKP